MMDDLLFKYKNKEYGAYYLRKKYNKYLAISLLTSILLIGLFVLLPFLLTVKEQYTENFIISKTIVAELAPMEDIRLPEIEEPKPQPAPEQPKVIDKPEEKPEALNDSIAQKKDSTETELAKKESVPRDEESIDGDGLFSFNTRQAFSQWVDENYNRKLLEKNKMEGTILLQFSVNERGFVDGAKVLAGLNLALDNEATRVVLSSPKWKPFQYNGQRRRMEYVIPINIRNIN